MIGDSTLTGGVFLRLDQEPPGFSADLHGGVLDLAWLGGGLAATGETEAGGTPSVSVDLAGTGTGGAAPQPARWSDETIDLTVLDRLSGTLALDAEALLLGAYRIEQADVDLAVAEGTLTLRSLTGRLFDGALKADGSLAGGPMPAGQAAFGSPMRNWAPSCARLQASMRSLAAPRSTGISPCAGRRPAR